MSDRRAIGRSDIQSFASDSFTLAAVLRGLRKRALLTQEELASRAGLSTRTVSNLESGRIRQPRSKSVILLADALNLAEPDRMILSEIASGRLPSSTHRQSPRTGPPPRCGTSGVPVLGEQCGNHSERGQAFAAARAVLTVYVMRRTSIRLGNLFCPACFVRYSHKQRSSLCKTLLYLTAFGDRRGRLIVYKHRRYAANRLLSESL